MTNVLVTGASGYVGGRLVPELLASGHTVRCMVRTPEKLDDAPWRDNVEVVRGDVSDAHSTQAAMSRIDVVFFLVHSMGHRAKFDAVDRDAATVVRVAAERTVVRRIIYLGGLGRDNDPVLSAHLASRHAVGRLLAAGPVPVTELRAAIIIGSGSASFEMLRYLVEVLPVMVTPRWVENRCQPIAVRDVLAWLVGAVADTAPGHHVVEIGGPDVLTYRQMMETYADVAGLPRRIILGVPLLTPRLSSLWVGLVTPLPAELARPLVQSLINEVVVHQAAATLHGPTRPLDFRTAVELAVRNSSDRQVQTRWSDAALPSRTPADPLPTDPDWAGGSVLVDEQEVDSTASPTQLFTTVAGIGGDRGWYAASWLWHLRGWLDTIVGGVGMRRGRRHPDELGVGDALDFWRVEGVEPGSLIRLRAEMRLPGDAWLEWHIEPQGSGSRLTQRAIFFPRGLLGRLYWYALLPFHALIFGRLAHRLARGGSI